MIGFHLTSLIHVYYADCSTPSIDHASFFGDTFYTGTPVVTCDAGYDKTGTAVCQTDGSWILPTCNAKGKCRAEAQIPNRSSMEKLSTQGRPL